MIEYIKLKNHKGIDSLELKELGHINVICGKNNSGKTTILEAINEKTHYGVGKIIDENIINLFRSAAEKFSSPIPTKSIKWFTEFINGKSINKEIWFYNDLEQILSQINSSMKQDPYMKQFELGTFDFFNILNSFFSNTEFSINPFLIPPKRSLNYQTQIATNEEIYSDGRGIINKLFYLKNQDLKSTDYSLFQSVYRDFEFVTTSNFNIIPKKNNELELVFKNQNNDWISAQNSGMGLSDTLIMLSLVYLTNNDVILLEEPENHLHAEFQRRLLDCLKKQDTKQFFIATHSNIFLNPGLVDCIIYTEYDKKVNAKNETSRASIISALGYSVSDNLAADLLILTEGPTDIPIIETLIHWRELDLRYNIKYWPLGGDMMANLDLDVFSQNMNVFALIDSDLQSTKIRQEFKRNCKSNNIKCTQLKRYAIENYFTLDAIKKVFSHLHQIRKKRIDPDKSVKSQLGFNIKSKNHLIIKNMTEKDFSGTDLLLFINSIEEFLLKNVT